MVVYDQTWIPKSIVGILSLSYEKMAKKSGPYEETGANEHSTGYYMEEYLFQAFVGLLRRAFETFNPGQAKRLCFTSGKVLV